MIITRKAIPRRTMLRGLGATLALPLLDGMVPALTAQSLTAAGRSSLRRDVRRQRHDHGELDAGGRRRRLRADADAGLARPASRSRVGPEQPGVRAHGGASRRRAREGEHAVSHRRVAADERDVARRGHLGRSDPGERGGEAHAARLARARDRIGRDRRRVRRRLRVRLHEHHLVAQRRTRRCPPSTTRASSSSGCSATAAARRPAARRARIAQDRSILDSVVAEAPASADRSAPPTA